MSHHEHGRRPVPARPGVPVSVVLGIDLGERRIGIAAGDTESGAVTPLLTLRRGTPEQDALPSLASCAERRAEALVVGLPLHLDGTESEQSRRTRAWVAAVDTLLTCRCHCGTSASPARPPRSRLGRPPRGRSGGPPSAQARRAWRARVDREAAADIVQRELDARDRAWRPRHERPRGTRPRDGRARRHRRGLGAAPGAPARRQLGRLEGPHLRRRRHRRARRGRLDRGPARHRPGGHRALRGEPGHHPHAHRRGPPARGAGRPRRRTCWRTARTEVHFVIEAGQTIDQIQENLVDAGLLTDTMAFRYLVVSDRVDQLVQAGTYTMTPRMSPSDVVSRLAGGPRPAHAGHQPGAASGTAHRADRGLPRAADPGGGPGARSQRSSASWPRNPHAELCDEYPFLRQVPDGNSLEGFLPGGVYPVEVTSTPTSSCSCSCSSGRRNRASSWRRRARRASTSTTR